MQDDYTTPPQRQATRRRGGGGRALLGGILLALLAVGGIAGWMVYQGKLHVDADVDGLTLKTDDRAPAPAPTASLPAPAPQPAVLEGRLAALEQRLAQVDLQANAASSNAARAEGLLVAFAARRAIERGLSLGYLEPQLKLRFGEAQPAAVAQLIEAGQKPVTRDQLLGKLDALAPSLEDKPANASGWARIQQELASLFVVRRDDRPTPRAADRLARARLMLQAGRTEQAIEEVAGLPNAGVAAEWLAAARRLAAAQRALDQIETSALLEPHGLNDARGRDVRAPSPLAQPVPSPAPTPAPAASPSPAPAV